MIRPATLQPSAPTSSPARVVDAPTTLPDIQGSSDHRAVPIQKAGVKNLRYPIVVRDRAHKEQATVGRVDMSVGLPHHFKGTHMSRFIEVLNQHRGELTLPTLKTIVRELEGKLEAETAYVSVEFPYFIERAAPVSGAKALLDIECRFEAKGGPCPRERIAVRVPVTTLCPCSKAISDRGAHNQRTLVTVEIDCGGFVWIEDLVTLIEESASCPVFPLLKRPDEKWVTEYAYDHPKFVEDVVRDAALRLQKLDGVLHFSVEAESEESIHNHNAYALVEGEGPGTGR